MPRFDRTGPMGMGPRTGRGMGPCCGCWGYGLTRFRSSKDEIGALDEEEKILEEELKAVKEEKAALKERPK